MKEERIVIEISPEGGITADAAGFTDGACLQEIDRLLDGLTGGVEQVERKPDARERRATRQTRRTVGRKR